MSRAVELPGSVLIYVGVDPVGDGLIKLPFARALRNAFPDAEITWLAGRGISAYAHSLAPLVRGLIDQVVEEAGVGRRWGELLRPALAGTPLAGRRFDLIIDTQRRLGTTLLLKRVPHGCFVSAAADFRLSDRRPPRPHAKTVGMARRLLELLELASGRPADTSGAVSADAQLDALAEKLLPAGQHYVGLAPGAGSKDRCWPLERYLELGAAQVAAGRTPVFFLGPEEGSWALPVREALPQALLPLQSAALAQLGPSPLVIIALARRLAAAVANDAGVGHMMAAANCPLVSLFGPTSPEKSAPLVARARVLSARSYGGEAIDCIPPQAVRQALDALLTEDSVNGAARARPDEVDEAARARPGEERRLFGGETR